MIVFERVSFAYGRRPVLQDLNFSIGAHERVAILGESGEGKTTILKLIMGLIRPDSGAVLVDGEDITAMEEEALRPTRMKFSIVFQEGALFDSLTVKENVAFCLREHLRLTEEEIHSRVEGLLKTVGMEGALTLMPEELSGGMHRRVAIARSLAASNPKMFLYDEPTSGLDPINADTICKLILNLAEDGTGLIIVTHKIFDAFKVASRFLLLRDCRILFDGSAQEVKDSNLDELRLFMRDIRGCV